MFIYKHIILCALFTWFIWFDTYGIHLFTKHKSASDIIVCIDNMRLQVEHDLAI